MKYEIDLDINKVIPEINAYGETYHDDQELKKFDWIDMLLNRARWELIRASLHTEGDNRASVQAINKKAKELLNLYFSGMEE